ncbi:sulfotransferase [Actinoplanes sp. TFC3]|uniref:sulfotransferase family protein n=1 Tax=Actinoplanes sp. TFC3 TaxID=1710355 RepID=UPI0008313DEE|nr:sulfotransferase [Actinoplanes sp. TFC3]
MNQIATLDELHAAATAATGLSDFGDTDYREGLQRILWSYERESALTPLGVDLAREELVGILAGRLSSEYGWRQHPEHRDVPIERPVFVVGPTRTGTTTLHRLLTADPAHQGLETWLGFFPQPRPPRAQWPSNPGFQRTQAGIEQFLQAHPGYAGVHNRRAGESEECWLLTRQSVTSAYFEFTADVPSYTAWRRGVDMTATYERHRRNLQLVGLNDPGRRWILKYAGHMLCIDALLTVYPGALIVQTHRRPHAKVLASTCSMVRHLAAGRSEAMSEAVIGQRMLALMQESMTEFRQARARHDESSFFDVDFAEFVAEPIKVAAAIYERLGIELTPQTHAEMEHVLAVEDGLRQHQYALADFGLSASEVEARMAGVA